ncbi:Enolase-phosphatase E1 [Podila minutissima]|uniref:Enolase-phosphatase E1 n=1 Tax=Podila minutissima TaxID=64525 RepID=A0A9P5SCB3_9FUNG|nr:Enolase-phosphatase E1 [Podila minutissima]
MVLTRSRSNANAQGAPAPTTSAPKAAPKRKNSNKAASEPVAKVAKTGSATDLAEAKETSSAVAPTKEDETSSSIVTKSEDKVATPPALAAPATSTIPAPVEVASIPAAAPTVAASEEPSVHNSNSEHATLHPYEAVVSDIEGTTTPIVFVKENLFPYVTSKLTEFLKRNWAAEEMKTAIEDLRIQAAKDIADGLAEATPIAVESAEISADKVQQDVIACIGWQMKADRKIGALKAFQGYMWKEGYTNGDLKGEIYPDVIPSFDQWKSEGKKLYIYSSGSISAQKLLFGFSQSGDVLHYFAGHYDTTIGQKVEAESYTKIAKDIGLQPSKILFLSDNIHEIVAAKKAGLQAVVTDRPGNEPLTADERAANIVVKSFSDIPKPASP